jgi:hypothetical protein
VKKFQEPKNLSPSLETFELFRDGLVSSRRKKALTPPPDRSFEFLLADAYRF